MELPDDLKQIRALFEEAERSSDAARKYDLLQNALVELEEYEEDHPEMDAPERTFLENLKLAHTRRLLHQLLSIPTPDILTWLKYYLLFPEKLKNEVTVVLQEHPELQGRYDEFKEYHWKTKRKQP